MPIKKKRSSITLKTALKMMSRNSILVKMHEPGSEDGMAYFVIPGGHVDAKDAAKIIDRPDVCAGHDGLFPGCSQTWRLGVQ